MRRPFLLGLAGALGLLLAIFARPVAAGVVSIGAFPTYLAQALLVSAMPTTAPTSGQGLTVDSNLKLTWAALAAGDVTGVTETGDALVITDPTGPAPSIAAQANVEALADAGTMVAGDLFYATSSTAIARLAKGTADQTLRMNAGATAPEWDTVSSGSALFATWLDPRDGVAPAGTSSLAMALYSTRNGHPVQEFPASEEDATEDDSCEWVFRLPSTFSSSNNLQIDLLWMAEGATSGDVVWYVEIEAFGATELDLDGSSFDAAQTVTTTTSGTDGNTVLSSFQLANADIDGAAGGDYVRVRITRNSNEAADTLAVRAQLLGVGVEEEAP